MTNLELKIRIADHIETYGFLNVSLKNNEAILKDVTPYHLQSLITNFVTEKIYKVFYFKINGKVSKFLVSWDAKYGDIYETVKTKLKESQILAI